MEKENKFFGNLTLNLNFRDLEGCSQCCKRDKVEINPFAINYSFMFPQGNT